MHMPPYKSPKAHGGSKIGCRRTQGLIFALMSVDQVTTATCCLKVHSLVRQEESNAMYSQQPVQACDHMVHLSHLYVHVHWIPSFCIQVVHTSCLAAVL